MKVKIGAAVLGSWMVCSAVPLFAHHSFQSTFDIAKPVQIEGKVTQLNWGNPHASFDVMVVDGTGGTASWRVELPSPNALIRGGWNRNSISVGSTVAVGGYAAKTGERLIGAASVNTKATGQTMAIPVDQSWKLPERSDERYNAGDPIQLTDVIQVNGMAAKSGARKVFAPKVLVTEKGGRTLASPVALLNSTPLIP